MAVKSVLDVLTGAGVITAPQAAEIGRDARKKNVSIDSELFSRGISEENILKAKGEALGIEIASLAEHKVPFELLKAIPEESARHYQFVPIGLEGGVVQIGMV